ncbi:RNA polymerase II largest subunit [Tanacetum coccineum]
MLARAKVHVKGGDDIESVNQDGVKTVEKGDGGCGSRQPTITIDGMKMVAEYKLSKKKNDDAQQLPEPAERKQQLSAERVLSVLKRISDDDCLLLGLDPKYARPDWMILQVLPIPPPPVRPSVMMDTSTRCDDDLTHQLATIIRHNENLRRQECNGAPAHVISEFCQLLQFHIAAYFDNEFLGQPRATQRSGRPIKSICNRLKAKEGRIRGVPWSIALNLTYPETVTPYNKERDDGQRLDLRYLKGDHHLELGYKAWFSIGIGDTIADASTMETINETIFRAKNEVNGLIRAAQYNQLEPEPGRTMMESFENKVNQVLNKARDDAGSSAQKSSSESNNLKAMNVEGKRIPFGFMDRTLPHFTKDDYGPESCGFVENSYLRAFFMQWVVEKYDGTVNSLGDVIQFLYGAVWIESQKLDSLKVKKGEFDRIFKHEIDEENWNPSYMKK